MCAQAVAPATSASSGAGSSSGAGGVGLQRPDGDVELADAGVGFTLATCSGCGDGPLKPDVVFFGDNIPPERKDRWGQRDCRRHAETGCGPTRGAGRWGVRAHDGICSAASDRAQCVGSIVASVSSGRPGNYSTLPNWPLLHAPCLRFTCKLQHTRSLYSTLLDLLAVRTSSKARHC